MRYEQGNILFLILIAVVLFAALSYAVTQSSRSGGDVSREVAQIAASSILQASTVFKQNLTRMKIVDGYDETEVSFSYAGAPVSLTNADCLSSDCEFFSAPRSGYPGTDLSWFIAEQLSLGSDYGFVGTNCIPNVGNGGTNCASDTVANEELLVTLRPLKKEICIEINEMLGVENPSGNPPANINNAIWVSSWSAPNHYSENFAISDAGGLLHGQEAGCFSVVMAGQNVYTFYSTLVAN